MQSRLKFISYDGSYPHLCCGTLIMELDGKEIKFPEYCLSSGGSVLFDENNAEEVNHGEWNITKFPKYFPKELKEEAIRLVNQNVDQGCCGGCV